MKVNPNLAMTGEITLTGRVLPIGGLREKAMAAYRAGIPEVLIPEGNLPDLEKVDEAVKASVAFHGIGHVAQISEYALMREGGFRAQGAGEAIVPARRKPVERKRIRV
jgi:ATP-dependent Lon protease